MKKFLVLLLALLLVFSMTACGGSDEEQGANNPSDSQQEGDGGDSGNGGNEGADGLSWPSADFITPGMAYTGGGEITYVDYIDGSTQEGGGSQYGVYINGGTIDDAKTYIEALKADGFAFYSAAGEEEPKAEFEFGYYQWNGEADGGDRFVSVYVGEEVDTYGMSGAEYTMYIMMMNQNLYE